MKKLAITLVIIAVTAIIPSCSKLDYNISKPPKKPQVNNSMVMYWNDKANTVLSVPMIQPTRARHFAIISIAVHDALNSVYPEFETYALKDTYELEADPNAAVLAAAYHAIKGLNLQGDFPIEEWYAECDEKINPGDKKEKGLEIGKKAADAIVQLRSSDGVSQVAFASEIPPNGTKPGEYRQTNLNDRRFVSTWGTTVKLFVEGNLNKFTVPPPPATHTGKYAEEYNYVKVKGPRENSQRTPKETNVAIFWSDNRPSWVWNNVATEALNKKPLDAWETAHLFALMHTAIADGATHALRLAYEHYYWRPETAIREGENDNNPQTAPVPNWVPFLIETPNPNPNLQNVSPPIPEYPATFAIFGGAFSETMKMVYNSSGFTLQLTSNKLPELKLVYTKFDDISSDNSLGKVFAGWHFRNSANVGNDLGKKIARHVEQNAFRKNKF